MVDVVTVEVLWKPFKLDIFLRSRKIYVPHYTTGHFGGIYKEPASNPALKMVILQFLISASHIIFCHICNSLLFNSTVQYVVETPWSWVSKMKGDIFGKICSEQ